MGTRRAQRYGGKPGEMRYSMIHESKLSRKPSSPERVESVLGTPGFVTSYVGEI